MPGLLHRRQQIGFKLEATEGTAETPAAVDADLLVYDVEFDAEVERNPRNPSRKSLTPLQSVAGKRLATVTFGVELKGSGAIATAPSYGKCLKACKMQENEVKTIAIGAISNGPYTPGMLITGGTSAAVGRVVDRVATGAAVIPYVVVSGVFQSGETITGTGGSPPTATSSGTPSANQGKAYEPVSSGDPSATISFWHDGLLHKLFGARGNVTGEVRNGGIAMLRFSFQGVYDDTTDVAMPDPTHESTIPVAAVDAQVYLDTYQPILAQLSFDLANQLYPRESMNATRGLLSVRITERTPTVSIDPETATVAEFPWWTRLVGSTTSYLRAQVGSVAGNRMVVAFPALSYEAVKKQNRGDLQVVGVSLAAVSPNVSQGDNEVLIVML